MARILIVAGGCRGLRFAAEMIQRGHAVRATTRTEAGRAALEAAGAECWIGTPDRLATLRGALENVTIACWMLAGARGSSEDLTALHSTRLQFFLGQAIDTTVRGVIYDASPARASHTGAVRAGVDAELLARGARIARELAQLNAIPLAVLGPRHDEVNGGHEDVCDGDARGEQHDHGADPGGGDDERWVGAAAAAADALLWRS